MQFNKKFLVISIVLVILALVGWRIAKQNGLLGSSKEKTAEEVAEQKNTDEAYDSLEKSGGSKETPIAVEAAPVLRGDLIKTVSAQGRVYAYQQMDLISEASGRLVSLKVKDGSRVKKGDIIAQVDDREYRLAIEDAKSQVLEAKANYILYDEKLELKAGESPNKANYAGLEKKYRDGLISKEQYERDRFALDLEDVRSGSKRLEVVSAKTVDKAQVALEKAQINLDKCVLRAPFSGTIFGVEVTEGMLLGGSTKIAKLINLDDLVVKAQVLESEIGQVTQGRAVRVNFTALPELEDLTGTVKAISPFVNETNKTVEAVLSFKNKDERVRPGMFAEAKIDAAIFTDRLMVPKTAILPRDNRKVVFKVSTENRAKWEYVTTGEENDQYVEITEGNLEPGDMVLTDNHFTMGHDTLVSITPKE